MKELQNKFAYTLEALLADYQEPDNLGTYYDYYRNGQFKFNDGGLFGNSVNIAATLLLSNLPSFKGLDEYQRRFRAFDVTNGQTRSLARAIADIELHHIIKGNLNYYGGSGTPRLLDSFKRELAELEELQRKILRPASQ